MAVPAFGDGCWRLPEPDFSHEGEFSYVVGGTTQVLKYRAAEFLRAIASPWPEDLGHFRLAPGRVTSVVLLQPDPHSAAHIGFYVNLGGYPLRAGAMLKSFAEAKLPMNGRGTATLILAEWTPGNWKAAQDTTSEYGVRKVDVRIVPGSLMTEQVVSTVHQLLADTHGARAKEMAMTHPVAALVGAIGTWMRDATFEARALRGEQSARQVPVSTSDGDVMYLVGPQGLQRYCIDGDVPPLVTIDTRSRSLDILSKHADLALTVLKELPLVADRIRESLPQARFPADSPPLALARTLAQTVTAGQEPPLQLMRGIADAVTALATTTKAASAFVLG